MGSAPHELLRLALLELALLRLLELALLRPRVLRGHPRVHRHGSGGRLREGRTAIPPHHALFTQGMPMHGRE
jgi:hypothetical protein